MKNKNLIIVGVIALVIGGAAGFFGGMKYQESKATTARSQFAANFGGGAEGNGATRRFGSANGGANGMAVRGQIISADNNSITVKLSDGSTKIIILGSSAMIAKTTAGTAADLTTGQEVTIFGTTNSDGSVTATNVQIGNAGMFGGPRPSGTPAASPAGY
ncbi:MAG TPA: hypothetical protein VG895_03630 [Patescibacteria group bacterium]|nr:hypothetical protein [Patescibacteria group bacterium]